MTGEQWYLGIHSEGSIDDTRKATLLGEVGYRGITEHPSKEEARKEGELMLRKLSVKGGGIVDHCGGRKVYHLA